MTYRLGVAWSVTPIEGLPFTMTVGLPLTSFWANGLEKPTHKPRMRLGSHSHLHYTQHERCR